MGGSSSKPEPVALTGGGATARAAAYTAPPAVSERHVGLSNIGNSCYCNSVLQSLYFVPTLRKRLLDLDKVIDGSMSVEERLNRDEASGLLIDNRTADELRESTSSSPAGSPTLNTSTGGASGTGRAAESFNPADTILSRLSELFNQLDTARGSGKTKYLNPKVAVNKIKSENILFKNTMQQDAHEFASFVINAIIEDERKILGVTEPKVTTALQRLFGGRLVCKTYCGECDTETQLEQPLLDINVDVQQNTSMRHCTELLSAYETLSGDDKFRCDACTSPVDARRRVMFKALPEVLFVQMKRFSYSERVGGFTKRNDRVAFASTTTLHTVDGEARQYRLAGIVVHQGGTPHMGHYVAICHSAESRRWYKCDDETITAFNERDLQRYFGVSDAVHESNLPSTATAYLMFYYRVA